MAINIFPRVDVTGTNRWSPLRKGHWSTQGLALCLPFGQAAPASLQPHTLIGAPSGAYGGTPKGINYSATSAYTELISSASGAIGARLPTQCVTVLYVRQCADTTARNNALFGLFDATTAGKLGAIAPFGDGNAYWDFGGATAPNRISVAFTKTTQVESLAFVAGRNGSAIYRNGVSLVSQGTAITRTSIASGGFRLNGGNGNPAALGDLQQVQFFALLDAEWLPCQVAEWAANPWLMFGTSAIYSDTVAAPATGRTSVMFIG